MLKTIWTAALAAMMLLACGNSPAQAFFGLFDSHTKVTAQGEDVRLDLRGMKAGEARFFRLDQDGKTIRFFLVKDKRDKFHAALDACDVCWREAEGYKLDEGAMLCVNCGMKFPLARIGVQKGGCNPHPVEFAMESEHAVIRTSELLAGAGYFPENP